jgi:hypothetical protein
MTQPSLLSEDAKITYLSPSFSDRIGNLWNKQKHRHLSFSSDVFCLETLEGKDKGLMHEDFNRAYVESLDVSDNALTEIDCLQGDEPYSFTNLKVIKARKNKMLRVELNLPNLIELNLSYNNLVTIPALSGLKNLEVLIVGHNMIKANSFDALLKATKLHRVDLCSNQFLLKPSELKDGLVALGKLKMLNSLRLKDNPFCQYFPEYQFHVISALKRLQRFDDVPVTADVQEEAKKFLLEDLQNFDTLFQTRKEQKEKERAVEGNLDGGIPLISDFIAVLEEAVCEPTEAMKCVSRFVHMVDRTVSADKEEYEQIFVVLAKADNAKQAMAAAIEDFAQVIIMLIERCDEARVMLLRCLAKLTVIHIAGLGEQCCEILDKLMMGGSDEEDQILQIIKEIMIPQLMQIKMNDPSASVMLKGLANLDTPKLGDALSPLIERLSEWFCDPAAGLNENVIFLLTQVTKIKANAFKAVELGVPEQVVNILETQRTLTQNDSLRPTYINIVTIIRNTAINQATADFYAEPPKNVHQKLVTQLRQNMAGNDLTRLKLIDLKTASYVMDALVALMEQSEPVLIQCLNGHEGQEGFKVQNSMILAPQMPLADPMILASSIDGLRVILENPRTRGEHLKNVVEAMQKLSPLLQYLSDKKYNQLYSLAVLHTPSRAEANVMAPPFSQLHNRIMHTCFVAIIRFIEFFTAIASQQDPHPLCVEVSMNLNSEQRETILFRLLEIPSDDVKHAVMNCIKRVNLEELETEEIGFLVMLIADNKDLGAGKTEELLEKVINQLQRLAEDVDGAAGEIFRREHAVKAVYEIFQVLLKNSGRKTYDNLEEEMEKIRLSQACVCFLRCVSAMRDKDMIKFLRDKDKIDTLKEILKNEDDLHSPMSEEIIIERSWTGRSVESLLVCFTGQDKLRVTGKVSFRVAQRLADILDGRSDLIEMASEDGRKRPPHYHDLARRETVMWDDDRIDKTMQYMDDLEWDDRITQHQAFASFQGLERMLQFLWGVFSLRQIREISQAQAEETMNTQAFIQNLTNEAETLHHELVAQETAKKANETVDTMAMEDIFEAKDDRLSGDKAASRAKLMGALQEVYPLPKRKDMALFLRSIEEFEFDDSFFIDESKGIINIAYHIAIVLRCANAMLVHNVAEAVKLEIIEFLEDTEIIRKFLALLRIVPVLSCNVAAKFLRVMSHVLVLPPKNTHEPASRLLLYDMMSVYVESMCQPALQRLKQTRDMAISTQEQTLFTEMTRLINVIVNNVPYITFSRREECQTLCIEASLNRLVTDKVLITFVQMSLYDLQVDTGTMHGDFVSDRYVLNSMERQGMREMCGATLALQLFRCPKNKYAVLEQFGHALIFGQKPIRKSFMEHILDLATQGRYLMSLEKFFCDKNSRLERMLLAVPCYLYYNGALLRRKLCITTHAVYTMEPPNPKKACGVCPSENFCPHEPKIEKQFHFKQLSRLVKGYGNQAMTFVREDETTGGEFAENIICESYNDRDKLLEVVHILSSPGKTSELEDRAQLEYDHLFQEVVKQHVQADFIAALTFAYRADQGHRVSLFVLSDVELFEFQVNWENWGLNPDAVGFPRIDGIGPRFENIEDLAMEELEKLPSFQGGPSNEEKKLQRLNRRMTTQYADYMNKEIQIGTKKQSDARHHYLFELREKRQEVRSKGENERIAIAGGGGLFGDSGLNSKQKKDKMLKNIRHGLLHPLTQHALSTLKLVAFHPTEEPKLTFDIGGEQVMIQFFDDPAREMWRRALACALNRSDAGAQWVRAWTNQNGTKDAKKKK